MLLRFEQAGEICHEMIRNRQVNVTGYRIRAQTMAGRSDGAKQKCEDQVGVCNSDGHLDRQDGAGVHIDRCQQVELRERVSEDRSEHVDGPFVNLDELAGVGGDDLLSGVIRARSGVTPIVR